MARQIGNGHAGAVFKTLGEAPAAIDPGERPFDNPAFWQRSEAFGVVAAATGDWVNSPTDLVRFITAAR